MTHTTIGAPIRELNAFTGNAPEAPGSRESRFIKRANAALNNLSSDKMSNLGTGEAYVWSSKASDDLFTRSAVKIKCRPRVTQHGGTTKTAVDKDGQ